MKTTKPEYLVLWDESTFWRSHDGEDHPDYFALCDDFVKEHFPHLKRTPNSDNYCLIQFSTEYIEGSVEAVPTSNEYKYRVGEHEYIMITKLEEYLEKHLGISIGGDRFFVRIWQ